jgi:hypothetical protein
MAALPLLPPQSEGLHPPISPQPQRPPPPRQTKLPMTGPAELVTCDQTIEHTIRFCKQTLGWTIPRPRHPEQAERWTWLVVASTLGWFAELDDLLVRDHGALPEVQDFHERYTLVHRSVSQRDRSA